MNWGTVSSLLRVGACLLAAHASTVDAGTMADSPSRQQIEAAARASFPEYLELLALPNDAVAAADVLANAEWLQRAFARRGFAVRPLPNDGRPLVYAEYRAPQADAGTVLFYMHFDGQPVVAEQWAQPNPWIPVVKRRNAEGAWEAVATETLQTLPLDPELRVFARAAADDKGPIMMFLAAFDALQASGLAPAIHVKVLLDSEEEKGSPGIAAVARANAELLRADGLLIHDGPVHESDRPTLVFGNRGVTEVTLTVYGPQKPLHSGHYGNYVPNPAQRLAGLLATMKDDDGRVTVAGYYDTIALTAEERAILAAVGDDELAIRQRVGVARADAVGRNYQEALQYPSLNIRGLQSAAVGDKVANIVPHMAVAELDLRTTPEAGPGYLTGLLEKHIRAQGWYIAAGEPSAAERASHDKILSMVVGEGSQAARTPMDAPLGEWVHDVLREIHGAGAPPVRIRMMGGSLPTDRLVEALKLPFVIVPLVNADNNQHSFDENLRMGHYLDGVRSIIGLLRTPYRVPGP
jgi:acetylornithine deacetylase/succinyl-diaminopimelate desuccinylase-like protein